METGKKNTVTNPVIPTSETPLTETMETKEKKYLKQIIAGLVICLGTFLMGNVGGFVSPMIADLPQPGRSFLLDEEQISLLGSLMSIGGLLGGLSGGIFTDLLGRKTCMIYICCPMELGWLLIVYSNHVDAYIPMLYAGRVITGFCVGIMTMCVPNYLSEITSPEVRGALGACNNLFITIGILFAYAVGWVVKWSYLAAILSAVPVILMILLLPLPESPAWLMKNKRKLEAMESLIWLRGENANITQEINEIVINEQSTGSISIKEIFQPKYRKPFVLMFMEMLFAQCTGISTFLLNISSIFASATDRIDPNFSSVLVGVAMVIASLISVVLIERLGRRVLLLISSIFVSISMMVMGGYYYLHFQNEASVQNIAWLPLLCLITYIITYNIGYGSIPWLMMSEVFPSEVKGIATSIITALNWTFGFITAKTYSDMKLSIGNHGVFWFYGVIGTLSIAFTWISVPETKGKTFQEIQKFFHEEKQVDDENVQR